MSGIFIILFWVTFIIIDNIKKNNREKERIERERLIDEKIERWENIVRDLKMEENLLLYILDENNRPEYIEKLKKVYNSLEHKRDITHVHYHRRPYYTAESIYDDPFDRVALDDWLWTNRQEALAILMSEHGKLPVAAYISGWRYHPAKNEEYRKDLLELILKRIREHNPGIDINIKYIETLRKKAFYWTINGEYANPIFVPSESSIDEYKKRNDYSHTSPNSDRFRT